MIMIFLSISIKRDRIYSSRVSTNRRNIEKDIEEEVEGEHKNLVELRKKCWKKMMNSR